MRIWRTTIRLLTFRLTREEMLRFDRKLFIAGLIGTWIVGMGRYWDDERASLLQHLGLGSVIYIFVLAAIIWLIILPFKIERWNYFTVLTFISLTSFPAMFYAIPVERFWSIETANTLNVWFLAIVASWRLCLLFNFLSRFTLLGLGNILNLTLMPICVIITVLTMLNLHRVVFDIMGGMRNPSPHDGAYFILNVLTFFSVLLAPFLIVGYGAGVHYSRKKANSKNTSASKQ